MKYYRTIEDLPIWNFVKINETNDVRYMLKLDDYYDLPKNKIDVDLLIDTYSKIANDLFLKFGFDEKFVGQKREEKELLIMNLRILSGEKHLSAILKIKEKQIDVAKSTIKTKNQSFEEKVVLLESYFKLNFDVYNMSVLRFHTYIDLYKKSNNSNS